MKKQNPSVCVIGAGCSGITAVKNLLQAGIKEVVCYEQNDQVGGNWIYTAGESHSSVCETTHIISSKSLSQFQGYPMPDDYPDYPSHRQVLAYFQAYAEHFGLLPYIRFNTRIEKVEKIAGERWRVQLDSGEERDFDYLMVANGHHSVPRHPQLNGNFAGEYLHSHLYKSNQAFAGKRVLVIGAGNSGCDCAVECSRVAESVAISLRRPHYIVPKFFLGKPTDTFNKGLLFLPKFIVEPLRQLSLRIQVGDYRAYGLPKPDFPVTKDHPTLNSELLYKIRHGKVQPRSGVDRVEGKTVLFADGRQEEYDVIIAATGYKIKFPFFDGEFLNYEEADRIPLYLRVFHPDHPSLAFIGLVQPQGSVWPLSDLQAQLVANYIMGRWEWPKNIKKLAEKEADEIARDFLQTKRHTIEVHFHPYARRLNAHIPKHKPEWSWEKTPQHQSA
jgi:cation diffusion facilitator CzcD-associated flavoprotein CzcO